MYSVKYGIYIFLGPIHWTEDGEDVVIEKKRFKKQTEYDYSDINNGKNLCMKMVMLWLKTFNFQSVSQSKNVTIFTTPYFKRDFKELIYALPFDLNWNTRGYTRKKTKKQVKKGGLSNLEEELRTEGCSSKEIDSNSKEASTSHIEGDFQREPLDLRVRKNKEEQEDTRVKEKESKKSLNSPRNVKEQIKQESGRDTVKKPKTKLESHQENTVNQTGGKTPAKESVLRKAIICICQESFHKSMEASKATSPGNDKEVRNGSYSKSDLGKSSKNSNKTKHSPGCNAWRNILTKCCIVMVPYVQTPIGMYPLDYIKTLCKDHKTAKPDQIPQLPTSTGKSKEKHLDEAGTKEINNVQNVSGVMLASNSYRRMPSCDGQNIRNREITSLCPVRNDHWRVQDNTTSDSSINKHVMENGIMIRSESTCLMEPYPCDSRSPRRSGSLTDLSRFIGNMGDNV